jgi:hypothetical protein
MEPLFPPGTFLPAEWRQAISVATTAGEMFVRSPEVAAIIVGLKVFAAVVTTLLAIGIVVLLVKMSFFSSKIKTAKSFLFMASAAEQEKVSREWERVKGRLRRGGDAELRLAVIEADQLLDTMLKRIGFSGNTMAERLERIGPWQLPNLPDVWVAHKMRNRLVHEPHTRITPYEAETALQIYEKALQSLGLLG